jgi:YesN/AraC family two-component response regulator
MKNQKVIKVIIADDEPHIRTLIKKIVLSMGMTISGEAANGEEAVKLYKNDKPDLVIMDINMPVKNGEEALKEIILFDKNARVIMLTSIADSENVKKSIEYGACSYIRKDNPIGKIRERIAEISNK